MFGWLPKLRTGLTVTPSSPRQFANTSGKNSPALFVKGTGSVHVNYFEMCSGSDGELNDNLKKLVEAVEESYRSEGLEEEVFFDRFVEPCQECFNTVHEIYLNTLFEMQGYILDGDYEAVLNFARARHIQTSNLRTQLQGMRSSMRSRTLPKPIEDYFLKVEKYFAHSTGSALSSPMRDVLYQLETAFSNQSNLKILKLNDPEVSNCMEGINQTVGFMLSSIQRNWPVIVEQYYNLKIDAASDFGKHSSEFRKLILQVKCALDSNDKRLGMLKNGDLEGVTDEMDDLRKRIAAIASLSRSFGIDQFAQ